MAKTLAMLLAGGRVDELSVLTFIRPKAAVPFGGLYRIIDFVMSNLMQSDIENVGVLSQYRSASLIHHLGDGSAWEMTGRERAVTILPPFIGRNNSDWYRGTADAVYQNLGFIAQQQPELVLVLSADHIYKMDYRPLVDFHLRKDADLTIAFTKVDTSQAIRFGLGHLDMPPDSAGGVLLEYVEKPLAPPAWLTGSNQIWSSMTVYLFRAKVLKQVLEQHIHSAPSSYEFGRDIIPAMLKHKYRVYGYEFKGYWGYARTIDEFWQTNMELLRARPRIAPGKWNVRTNLNHKAIRDRLPARVGSEAKITNSLIYSGCRVEGVVKNSILFPGVEVAAGARVENSILMYDARVANEVQLQRVIADTEVVIEKECRIGFGDASVPNEREPALLRSGITLIGKGAHIPPGRTLGTNCIVYPELDHSRFPEPGYESGTTIY